MPMMKQGDLGKALVAAQELLRSDPPLSTTGGTALRRLVRKLLPMVRDVEEARQETIKNYCLLEKDAKGDMQPKLAADKRTVLFPDAELQALAKADIEEALAVEVEVPSDLVLKPEHFVRLMRDKETGKVHEVDTVDQGALMDLGVLYEEEEPAEQEPEETPKKASSQSKPKRGR